MNVNLISTHLVAFSNSSEIVERDAGIPVMLIYGSRDPRINEDNVDRRQHLLPTDAHYVRIDGGDHHQFGSYEIKPQEHHASIDRADQQRQVIEQTLDLIATVSE